MRRLLCFTALALSFAVPLCAQRGGEHASGGHAGFGGGHASGFSGHAFSGGHMGGSHTALGVRGGFSHGPTHAFNRGFSRGPFIHNGFRTGFRGRDRFHNRFRNNCFGLGCRGWASPWWGAYYDPWLWSWDSDDARFDADYNNNLAHANEMNEQSLEQQRMWRQEEADGDQDLYARHDPPREQSLGPVLNSAPPVVSPTVLVFRDHHQQEIQNYAIVGQTLWNFASPRTQRIPLADLDLAATQKANDDRGVTFQVPGLNEG